MTAGCTEPLWARNGSELFYRNGNGDMIAVQVALGETFSIVSKQVLFSALPFRADANHTNYDVHPDGQRFLMKRNVASTGGELIWVEHWFEELKDLLGN